MRLIDSLNPHIAPFLTPGFDDYDDLWNEINRILEPFLSEDNTNSDHRQRTIFDLVQLVISTSLSLNRNIRTIKKDSIKKTEDCVTYLIKLARMEDGWYDEDSRAPSEGSVLKAIELLHLVPELDDLVSTGPIYEGGVILEYQAKNWSYSLEILNSGKIEFYGIEINGDGETDLLEFHEVSEQLIHRVSVSIT